MAADVAHGRLIQLRELKRRHGETLMLVEKAEAGRQQCLKRIDEHEGKLASELRNHPDRSQWHRKQRIEQWQARLAEADDRIFGLRQEAEHIQREAMRLSSDG
jgi:hypothetical protein